MTAPERAPLGATLALLLATVSLTGSLSPQLMAVAIAVSAVLIGIAWPDLLELPSAWGTRLVVGGTGVLGALLSVVDTDRFTPITGIIMICAIGVFASFVHQMLRARRHQLTASLTGTVAGVFITGVASTWVLAQSEATQSDAAGLVTATAAGLAVTLLLDSTPLAGIARATLSIVAGTAVTAALASSLAGVDPLLGALVGAVTAIGAIAAHLLLGSSLVSAEPAPSIAVAAAPVATVGVVAHLSVMLLT